MKKILAISMYYFKKNWLLVGALIFTFSLIYYFTNFGDELSGFFVNFWDPIFSVFSTLLVIGLTIIYVKKEWKNSLNKELVVHFTHNKKYVFSCYGVNLLPNADMRTLAQQIGRQMNGNQNLELNPSVNLIKSEVIRVKDTNGKENKWIKYNEIQMALTKKPEHVSFYKVWNLNNDTKEEKQISNQDEDFITQNKGNITIENLLSYDDENLKKFMEIKDSFNTETSDNQ